MKLNHSARLELALEELNERIHQGEEFPDAAWKVAQSFKVNQKSLEQAYDQLSY